METPICVVDATTLTDHIHDIKRWIYNGQLRLVVPSATYEYVEQTFQKTKEAKPLPKETARPRSSGKPVKKEHPTFDLNPVLAGIFLSRLKTWKEEEAVSEQRDFFKERENQDAVSFQHSSEQYTPWKDVGVEDEKSQPTDARPSTWAAALRKKQSLGTGMNGNAETPKGPVKPKLVAKTFGSESSPWKIKRDAPKLSAKDVPGSLRPLMSCALWRLHESIDRNDSNELFLLSDQPEVQRVSQKLNITVRSTAELRAILIAKAKRLDLESYGNLERDFGLEPRPPKDVRPEPASKNGVIQIDEKSVDQPVTKKESENGTQPQEGEMSNDDKSVEKTNEVIPVQAPEDLRPRTSFENDDANVKEHYSLDAPVKVEDYDFKASTTSTPPGSIIDANTTGQKQQVWKLPIKEATSFADIMKEAESPSIAAPVSKTTAEVTSQNEPQKAKSPPRRSSEAHAVGQDNSHVRANGSPPAHVDENDSPKSVRLPQDPEDSDEEIVVFVPQPKRFSNQKKPAQQDSRPSTPKNQPQQQSSGQPSRQSPLNAPAQSKLPNRGRNPVVMNQSRPQPAGPPTVIDPDAFGRSFAVNPNPNPNPGARGLHNHRLNHRPRRSDENAQSLSAPNRQNQHKIRASPSSRSLQKRSPRVSPAPEPRLDDNQVIKNHQTQHASPPKRMQILEPRDVASREVGPSSALSTAPSEPKTEPKAEPKTEVKVEPKSLSARMIESEEFVPGVAFKESQFGAIGTPPTVPDAKGSFLKPANANMQVKSVAPASPVVNSNSLTFSNLERNSQNGSRANGPRMPSGSNGLFPQSTTPIMQRRRTPEPEATGSRGSMQDVQYVLKSGSTRAATRGRGRLWTPD